MCIVNITQAILQKWYVTEEIGSQKAVSLQGPFSCVCMVVELGELTCYSQSAQEVLQYEVSIITKWDKHRGREGKTRKVSTWHLAIDNDRKPLPNADAFLQARDMSDFGIPQNSLQKKAQEMHLASTQSNWICPTFQYSFPPNALANWRKQWDRDIIDSHLVLFPYYDTNLAMGGFSQGIKWRTC